MKLRLALLALIVVVPALCALALLRWGARGDRAPRAGAPVHGAAGGVDRLLGGALDPGPLSPAHADLAGVSRCLDCHGTASEVLDAKCIACHTEIGQRAERALGWHGRFDEPCRTCHAEHRDAATALIALDKRSFQHDLTRFPLRGEHATAECEACHKLVPLEGGAEPAFRYQGVPFASCTSCHADPHGGRAPGRPLIETVRQVALDAAPPAPLRSRTHPLAGRDCNSCHTPASWSAAPPAKDAFDHEADAGFRLEGAHAALACESCHTPERRDAERAAGLPPGRGATPDCAGCHDDPHRGAIRRADGCASCHDARGWHLAFDHAAHTDFPLDALHAQVDCASCHADARFRAAGERCADCHTDAADLLAGSFGETRGAPDPHATLKCGDCHGPTPAENRPAAFAAACVRCHTPEYGALLATWTTQLDRASASAALDPERAERLRRSGVHNFELAHERLRATR